MREDQGVSDNILGIDPSYSGYTGYCYGKDAPKEWGILKPSEAKDWIRRFDLLKLCNALVIEDQFLNKNPRTLMKLVEAKGYWTQAARDHFGHHYQGRIIEIAPQKWMQALTRSWKFGKGSKKNMEEIADYILKRYGVKETRKDALCAIGIWTWGRDNL